MKSLRKLLRSKGTIVPIALVAVGFVIAGCNGNGTGDTTQQPGQPTQSTGQSPTITVAAPSPDVGATIVQPPVAAITGTLNVNVLDSFTRRPINGATVSVNVGGRNISGVTGPIVDGLTSLSGIPLTESQATTQPQPIQITITGAPGYPSPSFWAATLQRTASDTANSAIASEIIIELHATTGRIAGTLLDPVNGAPLAGVSITATPNPINVEISGGAFVRVDQPFGGLSAINFSQADGSFAINLVPTDIDYVIDIVDPQLRIANLRIGTPFEATAPVAAVAGGLGTGVEVPPNGVVNLDVGASNAFGVSLLPIRGGLSANLVANVLQGRIGVDNIPPFVTSATVGGVTTSQGTDVSAAALTTLASATGNIAIRFNEGMDPGAGISSVTLIDLGPKGTASTTGTRVQAVVQFNQDEVAAGVARTLLIKPSTALVPGRRYAVAGLGGLRDLAGNRYGGNQTVAAACAVGGVPVPGFPACDRAGVPDFLLGGIADLDGSGAAVAGTANETGVFFFTTNIATPGTAGTPLALTGAPTVTGKRNNLSRLARLAGAGAVTLPNGVVAICPAPGPPAVGCPTLGSRAAASFLINWTAVAPAGASAYNVCVLADSASGRTDCIPLPNNAAARAAAAGIAPAFPSVPPTTGTPATAFRVTMDDIQAILVASGRSLPLLTTEASLRGVPNTILDNNLRVRFRVSVLDRNGAEGPQSADAVDATVATLVDQGDNTNPSLNEDANFDGTEASGEDLDGDPPGAAVIFSDAAVRNYFQPGTLGPVAQPSTLAFPASVVLPATPATFAIYDVLQSAFPATSAATLFLGRVPFNNAAGARLDRTGTLRLTFIEDILPSSATTTSITLTDGTQPISGAATGTPEAAVTTVTVTDVDRDVTTGTNGNVVNVGVDNVFLLNTGDNLNVSVTDEAANAFTGTLRLLDTIRPFAVSVVVGDNGCGVDTVVITASEPLNAASVTDARTVYVVGGIAINGASKTLFSAAAGATPQSQVSFAAPNQIQLTFPDRSVFAAGSLAGLGAASTFFTTGTGAFGGVTDQAENRNLFLNDGTAIPAAALALIPTLGTGAPATTAFAIGDTIPPRLMATAAGLAGSTWRVAPTPPGPGIAGGPGGATGAGLTVVVEFTEPVDPGTASNPSNYVFTSIDTDAYTITNVTLGAVVGGGVTSVTVTFTLTNAAACVAPFPAANTCGASAGDRLTVSNVMDLAGNIIAVQNALILPAAATPAPALGTTYTVLACP